MDLKLILTIAIVSATSACSHSQVRNVATTANQPQTIGGQMIKGISVAYIHTPNKKMADWYENTLGLKKVMGMTLGNPLKLLKDLHLRWTSFHIQVRRFKSSPS